MSAITATSRAFYNLKARYHFWKFVKKPTDTIGIFEMTEAFQKGAHPQVVSTLLKPLLEIETIRAAYESKYWIQIPKLNELGDYPANSFGYAAYEFFKRYDLDPNLFPEADFSSPQSYLTSRLYQAHDFWHVLTGYSTGLEDELALQAFGVGQYKQPISLMIIAGGLIHLLEKTPERAENILAAIAQGFERGGKTRNLLTERVLERLADPLEDVRRDLNIVDIIGGCQKSDHASFLSAEY